MNVVIQCAAKKQPDAGCLKTLDGKEVFFVADPDQAPERLGLVYARPDEISDTGFSWRELLSKYNESPGNNPLGLCQAYELYQNPAYQLLTSRFGLENVYILSAGWGLIKATFLIPNYDITFSASADAYKRRRKSDPYRDMCQLPESTDEDVYFFGGKDYVPLFCELTETYKGQRTIFFNSVHHPEAPGCSLRRFSTRTRTNWHYQCVKEFCQGAISDVALHRVEEPVNSNSTLSANKEKRVVNK